VHQQYIYIAHALTDIGGVMDGSAPLNGFSIMISSFLSLNNLIFDIFFSTGKPGFFLTTQT
jgi:hypothetical protein